MKINGKFNMIKFERDKEDPKEPYDSEYPMMEWWASHDRTFASGIVEDAPRLVRYKPVHRSDHLFHSHS